VTSGPKPVVDPGQSTKCLSRIYNLLVHSGCSVGFLNILIPLLVELTYSFYPDPTFKLTPITVPSWQNMSLTTMSNFPKQKSSLRPTYVHCSVTAVAHVTYFFVATVVKPLEMGLLSLSTLSLVHLLCATCKAPTTCTTTLLPSLVGPG